MKNLNTILPFYSAKTEQYRYREDVEKTPLLVVTNTTLIPFIVKRPHSTGALSYWAIIVYTLDDVEVMTIDVVPTGCVLETGVVYDYFEYTGTAFHGNPDLHVLPTGVYYLKVSDHFPNTPVHYYSETFTVLPSVSTFLKLEFHNDTVIDGIPIGFHQVCYIDATLKTPEYLREDTGDKRDGLVVREKQLIMKSYILRELLSTEYFVDALMLVPLMDWVWLTLQSGEVKTFKEIRIKDPEWNSEAYGALGKIELQFIESVVIKKLTYKETGYQEGGDMSAIIKGGFGTTVYVSDSVYRLQVTFDTPFADTLYIPSVPMCYTTDMSAQMEFPRINPGNVQTTGFLIETARACNIRWTAIHL